MKKSWLLTALGCLLLFAACFLVVRCPRTVPLRQCSELYQRYAKTPGIDATFIKDFRVNDSVSIDVTLLEARDSAGWAMLQKDFNIPIIPKEYESSFYMDSNQVSIKPISKINPSLPIDSVVLNNNLIAVSFWKHSICIFSINSMAQLQAIIRNQLDNNTLK